MNQTIIITAVDGTEKELTIDGASMITVKTDSMITRVTLPKHGVTGSVHTQVALGHTYDTPEVSLFVGEQDADKLFKWATSAMFYITTSGRIMARNTTPGYASTDKPVATKPWIRKDQG
jgi:hypothetical protein